MQVLVTGSNGQLGNELRILSGTVPHTFEFADIDTVDLGNFDAFARFAEGKHWDAVINAAAYTAVDRAETDQANAEKGNVAIVENLIRLQKKMNFGLVHISTDFVFDGEKKFPYKYSEEDKTNPLNVYGKTKLEGENYFLNNALFGVVIRTSWLYSSFGNNFVKTIRTKGRELGALRVVDDQFGSPTYAADLADLLLRLLPELKHQKELYHFSNEGAISWFAFAQAIIEESNIECTVSPVPSTEYPTPALRPQYSVLSTAKIKNKFSITIPEWRESLRTCIGILNEKESPA